MVGYLLLRCPACGALEVQDDFPTAGQGIITDKYECGSEYYDGHLVYPCGTKPYVMPKIDLDDPAIKAIALRLSKM